MKNQPKDLDELRFASLLVNGFSCCGWKDMWVGRLSSIVVGRPTALRATYPCLPTTKNHYKKTEIIKRKQTKRRDELMENLRA